MLPIVLGDHVGKNHDVDDGAGQAYHVPHAHQRLLLTKRKGKYAYLRKTEAHRIKDVYVHHIHIFRINN